MCARRGAGFRGRHALLIKASACVLGAGCCHCTRLVSVLSRPRRGPALPHPAQVGEQRVGAWGPQKVAHVGALQHFIHWGVQLGWRDCRTDRWQAGGQGGGSSREGGETPLQPSVNLGLQLLALT